MVLFIFNSILLGVGLAMDAFSVSVANGLRENSMPRQRIHLIAGTYAFFQFLMPLTGWLCVHTVLEYFTFFQKFIPWIALILLCLIGGGMIKDGIFGEKPEEGSGELPELTGRVLILQGIAISIDALSVGFTIAGYGFALAAAASLIIAAVTHLLCVLGLLMGKRLGTRFTGRASILGGLILIGIGIEIFLKNH